MAAPHGACYGLEMPWVSNRDRRRGRFFRIEVVIALIAIALAIGVAAMVVGGISDTKIETTGPS